MLSAVDVEAARARARAELLDEATDREVERLKEEMRRRKPLLHRLFPWKINVTRR